MAEWTIPVTPIDPDDINGGNEFNNGDGVHADDLNNTVKAALYAQDKAEKASKGKDCQILVPNGVAHGENSIAGSYGFAINNINSSSITVALTHPSTSKTASTTGIAAGKYFSIISNTHFAFCGKVVSFTTSGSTATITFTSTTASGKTTSSSDPWWTLQTLDGTNGTHDYRPLTNGVLWFPEVPTAGYELVYGTNDEYSFFKDAVAFGETCYASADDCIVNGEENIAGANHAAIFGKQNKGGYGNIVAGIQNFSCGLHSAVFGRAQENYDDYNLISGRSDKIVAGHENIIAGHWDTITSGSQNAVFGYNNKITSGSQNVLSGYGNTIASGSGTVVGGKENQMISTYGAVFGNSHTVFGDQLLVFGNGNSVGGSSTKKCNYSIVGGQSHTIASSATKTHLAIFGQGHTINNSYVFAAGNGHTSSADYQTLLGDRAQSDANAGIIYANGGFNRFTVGKNGTRSNVSTDAVTVGFLSGVDNGSVVEVETNGSVSQELAPDKFYMFTGQLSALYLSFGAPVGGRENEYKGQFTVGSIIPVVSFLDTISWVGGSFPTLETNKTYQFSVLNNIGVIVGV